MSLSATPASWPATGRGAGGGSSIRSLAKIEEWVERSHAKIRADRAFDKLTALGCTGSERTVRRVVAEVKANHRRGRRRVYRPWIPEPGMWAQWDWGAGPVIAGRGTNLFCAWLAWSRFRVIEGLDMDGDAGACRAQTALYAHTDATEALARQRPPLHNTGAL